MAPPTDRQEAGNRNRKQEPDTAGPDTGMNRLTDERTDRETDRRTDGWISGQMEEPLSICADSYRDAKGRSEKKKKLKKVKDPYMYQIWKLFCFFDL